MLDYNSLSETENDEFINTVFNKGHGNYMVLKKQKNNIPQRYVHLRGNSSVEKSNWYYPDDQLTGVPVLGQRTLNDSVGWRGELDCYFCVVCAHDT